MLTIAFGPARDGEKESQRDREREREREKLQWRK